jgi:Conjugative transposon protein TcpC
MFRGPDTGNGERLSNYSHVVPLFGAAGSGRGGPGSEAALPGPWQAGRAWAGGGARVAAVAASGRAVGDPANHRVPRPHGHHFRSGQRASGWAPQTGRPVPGRPGRGVRDRVRSGLPVNVSPATQGQREEQLAAFAPPSVAVASPDRGWNGSGQLSLPSGQVAGTAVQHQQHAVVTLPATVNSQLMELGVPEIASGGGMVVAGEPAWLPAPQLISPPATANPGSDPVARSALMNELPAFFRAYASSDNTALSRFELRGVSLPGLSGAVSFGSITGPQVPPGGAPRQITVTVIWQVPGQGAAGITKLEMAYRMSVVDLQSGKWYVKEISAVTEAVGAK